MQVSSPQHGKGATYQAAHNVASMCTNINPTQNMFENTRKICEWMSLAKAEDATVMEISWLRYAVTSDTANHCPCTYSICSLVLGLHKSLSYQSQTCALYLIFAEYSIVTTRPLATLRQYRFRIMGGLCSR